MKGWREAAATRSGTVARRGGEEGIWLILLLHCVSFIGENNEISRLASLILISIFKIVRIVVRIAS